jgi:hypothetical protein
MSLHLKYAVLALLVVSGCSVYMESTRPTPIDLARFNPGDSRTSVTEQLGAPVTTSKGAGGTSCDLYLLYITGYGNAAKVPIAVAEGAADFFTIGLAEIVLSPTEAATRNEKKPVWFCYQNDALLSVTPKSVEAGTSTTPTPTLLPANATPSPPASFAATPVPTESPAPTGLATPVWSSPALATPTAAAPTGNSLSDRADR